MIPTKPYATGKSQSKMGMTDDHQSLLLRNHQHLKPLTAQSDISQHLSPCGFPAALDLN